MDTKAEIEKIITVHVFHGTAESITIKDNPDAPEIGAMLVHECDGQKNEIYIWKDDIEQIIKALQMFNKKEN
ncbi:MAG: hypothetical protein WC464_00215 [Bdellovibrionales bacterium]|jgi:hypothetical protein